MENSMTTLTRERKQKFNEILITRLGQHWTELDDDWKDETLKLLADASISRSERESEERHEYKLPEQSDPAFLLAVGQDITSEAQKARLLEHDAIVAFEKSFNCLTQLAWYSRKPKWATLRKNIVALYSENPNCFDEYKTWRLTPYVKGAVSLKDVQRDPDLFMASWSAFTESDARSSDTQATPKIKVVT